MRNILAVSLALAVVAPALLGGPVAYGASFAAAETPPPDDAEVWFSAEQLDNLLAPIALYPDPLLAQVLVAATFPDQIDEAARFLRARADPHAIGAQPWDVSVQAVAHYPTVLYMMADKLDWTTALGQAYATQSTDVMAAVQRLRVWARAAGHLRTTPQMEVVVEEGGSIAIWPAQPQLLYVPVYDPELVFFRRGGLRTSVVISFGLGLAIGAWLNYDFDWHKHHIYYHGWQRKTGWIHRSRPAIRITNRYVNKRYTTIRINRTVVNRRIHYDNLNRYTAVHRDVRYTDVRRKRREVGPRGERGAPSGPREVPNKIIRRNLNPSDPRIRANRGWSPERRSIRPGPSRETRPAPERRPSRETRPAPERRPTTPRTERPTSRPPARQMERRDHSVFRGSSPVIDPRAARQRGQASRQQVRRPSPTQRRPTRPATPPARRGDGGQHPGGRRRP
jgi:hypothetical protein